MTDGMPLVALTYLSLSPNQLTGPIPPELGRLSNLTDLNLWGNQLTGPIPPELGHLSNLAYLNLWGNQLTEDIPPELGRLSNLRLLYGHRARWCRPTTSVPTCARCRRRGGYPTGDHW